MEKSKAINVLLLPLLGVGAFALGWVLKPAPEGSPPAADVGGNSKGAKAGGSTLSAVRGSGSGGRLSSPASSGGDASSNPGAAAGRGALGDQRIVQLGESFKSALDPIQRRLAFSQLLEGLTVENALLVREQIAHLPGASPEFRDFHYAWGQIAGAEAVMHGSETQKPDMAAALSGWANADPDAAVAWFESLEADGGGDKNHYANREYLKMGIVQGLADSDPDRASGFVLDLMASGDGRAESLMGTVTAKYLQARGPEATAAWVDSLPEGRMRMHSMHRVAHEYGRQDPAAAAAWVADHIQNEGGVALIGAVTRQWTQRDPQAAVGWLESLSDGQAKTAAYHATFEGWVARDPQAASQYIVDMPASPDRDSAISGLVSRHRWEDPSAAIAWAAEIENGQRREASLVGAGQAYFRKDPAGAKDWLATSGLSPEVQKKITNAPRQWKRD